MNMAPRISSFSTLPDDELKGYPTETDLRLALAHKPDAVIVSNPTALHLDIAIPAAQCGCHLLLEKPISHSMARLDELVKAGIIQTVPEPPAGTRFFLDQNSMQVLVLPR